KGQRTPQEVVAAWMNSPGHRANILNKNYTHIGVGFEENGYIWTQQFIRK
ncbi:sporulation protein, partial [Parageobacillus sp. SY1]